MDPFFFYFIFKLYIIVLVMDPFELNKCETVFTPNVELSIPSFQTFLYEILFENLVCK